MEKHIGEVILNLLETHEDLWRIVDGMHSKNDNEAIAAARKNGTAVKKRSRFVEEIDEILIARIAQASKITDDKGRSEIDMAETFGSLIDKICINRLKIYHYNEKRNLLEAQGNEAKEISGKLVVLEEQGKDLADELEELLDDVISGRKRVKVYRQYKM